MMKTLLIFLIFINLGKGSCTETHDQVLSVTPKTQEQVDVMKNVSTQYETALWQPVSPHYIKEETQVHLFVPANSSETVKDLLQKHGITHEVLLTNANELIEMQTKNDSTDPRSSSTFYERYHSLEDIYYWINRTTQENPSKIKVILIGSSYEKRPLYALKDIEAEEMRVNGGELGILTVVEDYAETGHSRPTVRSIAQIIEKQIVLDDVCDLRPAFAPLFGLIYPLNLHYPKETM